MLLPLERTPPTSAASIPLPVFTSVLATRITRHTQWHFCAFPEFEPFVWGPETLPLFSRKICINTWNVHTFKYICLPLSECSPRFWKCSETVSRRQRKYIVIRARLKFQNNQLYRLLAIFYTTYKTINTNLFPWKNITKKYIFQILVYDNEQN